MSVWDSITILSIYLTRDDIIQPDVWVRHSGQCVVSGRIPKCAEVSGSCVIVFCSTIVFSTFSSIKLSLPTLLWDRDKVGDGWGYNEDLRKRTHRCPFRGWLTFPPSCQSDHQKWLWGVEVPAFLSALVWRMQPPLLNLLPFLKFDQVVCLHKVGVWTLQGTIYPKTLLLQLFCTAGI